MARKAKLVKLSRREQELMDRLKRDPATLTREDDKLDALIRESIKLHGA